MRVRQAINYAMDRETIVDVGQGWAGHSRPCRCSGPVAPAYDESLEGTYEYDLDKAKELMAEAGYADGFTHDAAGLLPGVPGRAGGA